jgi:hypothetical protein
MRHVALLVQLKNSLALAVNEGNSEVWYELTCYATKRRQVEYLRPSNSAAVICIYTKPLSFHLLYTNSLLYDACSQRHNLKIPYQNCILFL